MLIARIGRGKRSFLVEITGVYMLNGKVITIALEIQRRACYRSFGKVSSEGESSTFAVAGVRAEEDYLADESVGKSSHLNYDLQQLMCLFCVNLSDSDTRMLSWRTMCWHEGGEQNHLKYACCVASSLGVHSLQDVMPMNLANA